MYAISYRAKKMNYKRERKRAVRNGAWRECDSTAELTIIAIVALPAAFEPVSWNTAEVTVHPTNTVVP